jgi:hypothetical protein
MSSETALQELGKLGRRLARFVQQPRFPGVRHDDHHASVPALLRVEKHHRHLFMMPRHA